MYVIKAHESLVSSLLYHRFSECENLQNHDMMYQRGF